jgi:hypothetical protein
VGWGGELTCGAVFLRSVANLPAAGLLVSFSVFFTQAGGAFAHSLPSHLLARVMGVVIICMVPIVLFLGGKKNKHGDASALVAAASSAGESSVLVGPLGPVPDWTPEILRQRDDVQVRLFAVTFCSRRHFSQSTAATPLMWPHNPRSQIARCD